MREDTKHSIPTRAILNQSYDITAAEIDDYRRIIASFSADTAVAYDNLPPKALSNLSSAALEELIKLFHRCEVEERWPDTWLNATMVMIPKAEQYKWRLIAILVTPYRVWARKNGETVSSWMKGLQRDWIANGPGKAAAQAAYDIALSNESLIADDNLTSRKALRE